MFFHLIFPCTNIFFVLCPLPPPLPHISFLMVRPLVTKKESLPSVLFWLCNSDVIEKHISFQCVTKHVQDFNKCSQCTQVVNTDNPRYLKCLATLEILFPKIDVSSSLEDAEWPSTGGDKTISVVMLGGDSTVLAYQPYMTILALKAFIKSRLGPEPEKQRLLFKEQELKV